MRKNALGALIAGGVLLVAAVPAAAALSAEDAGPSATGWVVYHDDVALNDSTIRSVQGVLTERGCEFTSVNHGGSGDTVSIQREVAYNPDTCEMQLEEGTLTPEEYVSYEKTRSRALTHSHEEAP